MTASTANTTPRSPSHSMSRPLSRHRQSDTKLPRENTTRWRRRPKWASRSRGPNSTRGGTLSGRVPMIHEHGAEWWRRGNKRQA